MLCLKSCVMLSVTQDKKKWPKILAGNVGSVKTMCFEKMPKFYRNLPFTFKLNVTIPCIVQRSLHSGRSNSSLCLRVFEKCLFYFWKLNPTPRKPKSDFGKLKTSSSFSSVLSSLYNCIQVSSLCVSLGPLCSLQLCSNFFVRNFQMVLGYTDAYGRSWTFWPFFSSDGPMILHLLTVALPVSVAMSWPVTTIQ